MMDVAEICFTIMLINLVIVFSIGTVFAVVSVWRALKEEP